MIIQFLKKTKLLVDSGLLIFACNYSRNDMKNMVGANLNKQNQQNKIKKNIVPNTSCDGEDDLKSTINTLDPFLPKSDIEVGQLSPIFSLIKNNTNWVKGYPNKNKCVQVLKFVYLLSAIADLVVGTVDGISTICWCILGFGEVKI